MIKAIKYVCSKHGFVFYNTQYIKFLPGGPKKCDFRFPVWRGCQIALASGFQSQKDVIVILKKFKNMFIF